MDGDQLELHALRQLARVLLEEPLGEAIETFSSLGRKFWRCRHCRVSAGAGGQIAHLPEECGRYRAQEWESRYLGGASPETVEVLPGGTLVSRRRKRDGVEDQEVLAPPYLNRIEVTIKVTPEGVIK